MPLSPGANTVDLPIGGVTWTKVYRGVECQGGRSAQWRLVEVAPEKIGQPIEARINWTLGEGDHEAWLDVSTGARICVLAKDVMVYARHTASEAVRVHAAADDGQVATSNCWSLFHEASPDPEAVLVPPWARRVRVEPALALSWPSTEISLYDASGTLVAANSADLQGPDGIWMGRAAVVKVECPVGYRVIYSLHL